MERKCDNGEKRQKIAATTTEFYNGVKNTLKDLKTVRQSFKNLQKHDGKSLQIRYKVIKMSMIQR